MQTEQAFWMVWSPQGSAPTVRHMHEESAVSEAQRLARINPGREFFVLIAQAKYIKADVQCVRRTGAQMNRHTPGPWENREGTILADTREQVCCGRPCVGAEYMGQQEMVCCGNPDIDGDGEDPIATVKYERDIPLVIAAPDMLAELRECEAALASLLAGDPDLTPCVCGSTTLGNRLVHVRATIAKAMA